MILTKGVSRLGHLNVQGAPLPRESQQQAAWRVLVPQILLDDFRVASSLSDLPFADVAFDDPLERVTTEVELAR